jgi:hypothetical protein
MEEVVGEETFWGCVGGGRGKDVFISLE